MATNCTNFTDPEAKLTWIFNVFDEVKTFSPGMEIIKQGFRMVVAPLTLMKLSTLKMVMPLKTLKH